MKSLRKRSNRIVSVCGVDSRICQRSLLVGLVILAVSGWSGVVAQVPSHSFEGGASGIFDDGIINGASPANNLQQIYNPVNGGYWKTDALPENGVFSSIWSTNDLKVGASVDKSSFFVDVNGDGKVDILSVYSGVANSKGTVAWLGNGDGTYQKTSSIPKTVYTSDFDAVAISSGYDSSKSTFAGDFNEDNIVDILFVSDGSGGTQATDHGTAVWLGLGDGTFESVAKSEQGLFSYNDGTVQPYIEAGVDSDEGTFVVDVNNDGILDIVWLNGVTGFTQGVYTWYGKGTGFFEYDAVADTGHTELFDCAGAAHVYLRIGNTNDRATFMADANRDGKVDIISAVDGDDAIYVWKGNGDGTFDRTAVDSLGLTSSITGGFRAGTSSSYSSRVADVDNDGKLDYVWMNGTQDASNGVLVWLGLGNGGFETAAREFVGNYDSVDQLGTFLAAGADSDQITHLVDVDGDGSLDITWLKGGAYPKGAWTWFAADTDGDGVGDVIDWDDDNDGIMDATEIANAQNNGDTDGDGVPDQFDLDSDNDTLGDLYESGYGYDDPDNNGVLVGADSDGDGIVDSIDGAIGVAGTAGEPTILDRDLSGLPDYLDKDLNGDGLNDIDAVANDALDTDGDGRINSSIDVDRDGVMDVVDKDTVAFGGIIIPGSETDSDGDGLLDRYEDVDKDMGFVDDDTDADGTANYLDDDDDDDNLDTAAENSDPNGDSNPADALDSEGDGIPDYLEPNNVDTDKDGIFNWQDDDDDGDGIDTINEDYNLDQSYFNDDININSIPSFLDASDFIQNADTDRDGIPDALEDINGDGNVLNDDADFDGKPNYLDDDDDGDGIPTLIELGLLGILSPEDHDNDEVANYLEPNNRDLDGDGFNDKSDPDDDGDGILTRLENTNNNGTVFGYFFDDDEDGDGIPDFLDPKDLTDSDGDGLADADEDVDGNGSPMNDDTDNDKIPNYLDADDDGDDISTVDETLTADTDSDGVKDYLEPNNRDMDKDGVAEYNDNNDDSFGISNALDFLPTSSEDLNGNGNFFDDDFDLDGIPDFLDPVNGDGSGTDGGGDSDGDGISDADEDINGDGKPLFDDTDGDGLPNYMDDDDDGDDILTATEGVIADKDGDGVKDYLEHNINDLDQDGKPDYDDDDDDGDGLSTASEDSNGDGNLFNDDEDADGIPKFRDGTLFNETDDSDGDGLTDGLEDVDGNGSPFNDDTDGDGIPNYYDDDDDGDDVLTKAEGATEDEDGDGILDYLEPRNRDTDGDGTPDQFDSNDDGDALSTAAEDTNGNGNVFDDDVDGDGIPDYLDAANGDGTALTIAGTGDSDGDKLSDHIECPNGALCPDTDRDGIPNYMDRNDDGDLQDTLVEIYENNGYWTSPGDTDGDGVANYLEPDDIDTDGDGVLNWKDDEDDGDGIPTRDELGPGGAVAPYDSDRDGIPNYIESNTEDKDGDTLPTYLDRDSDGDGIPDVTETGRDWDGDGIRDSEDLDTDNDGIFDVVEVGGNDVNNDGIHDFNGDVDGDGISDDVDITQGGTALGLLDTDGDWQGDHLDLDSDNDGILDVTEAGGLDANGDGMQDGTADADRDGLLNTVDVSEGGVSLAVGDEDGDGKANYIDIDSDGDIISDLEESGYGYPDPNKNGVIESFGGDSDKDGILDIVDNAINVYGMSGVPAPQNTDGTDKPDYLDLDSDNDEKSDLEEGEKVPLSLDTTSDNRVGLGDSGSGTDSDSDGVDDIADGAPLIYGNPPRGSSGGDSGAYDDGLIHGAGVDANSDGVVNLGGGGYWEPNAFVDTGSFSSMWDSSNLSIGFSADESSHLVDVNGDGKRDILAIYGGTVHTKGTAVWLGAGDGTYARAATSQTGHSSVIDATGISAGLNNSQSTHTADLNGDGYIDILYATDASNSSTESGIAVWIGLGDGNFMTAAESEKGVFSFDNGTPQNYLPAGHSAEESTHLVDINKDGRIDYVWLSGASDGTHGIYAWYGNGDGSFTKEVIDNNPNVGGFSYNNGSAQTHLQVGQSNNEATFVADIDGDGDFDIISAQDSTDSLHVWLGNELGNFEKIAINTVGLTSSEGFEAGYDGLKVSRVADVNNDGNMDYVWINSRIGAANGVYVWRGNGDGTFERNAQEFKGGFLGVSQIPSLQSGAGLGEMTHLVDINGDGVLDITWLYEGGSPDGAWTWLAADSDKDGVADLVDDDDDNDGLLDTLEGAADDDGDGVPNQFDLDSDNDSIPDVLESGGADSNLDGMQDGTDGDGNGVVNTVDVDEGGTALTLLNFDGDSKPNYIDLDSDNDGINDVLEANSSVSTVDTNNDGLHDFTADDDIDGLSDDIDPSKGGALSSCPDSDGDGQRDFLDLDSDNDTLSDLFENGDTSVFSADVDDDGILESADDGVADVDGDGIIVPADTDDAAYGETSGVRPKDTDGDGLPDYLELDSDDDDTFDIVTTTNAGLDTNGDGVINSSDATGGTDSDKDGIDDSVDNVIGVVGGEPVSIAPCAHIAGATVVELTGGASLVVTLDAANPTSAVTIDYTSSIGNGTVNIPLGSTTATITLSFADDLIVEADEVVAVTLSNPVGARICTGSANLTITDDDVPCAIFFTGSDDDGDLYDKTLEYALIGGLNNGWDRVDGTSHRSGLIFAKNGSDVDLTWTRPAGLTDVTASIEVSSDLATWATVASLVEESATVVDNGDGTETLTWSNVSSEFPNVNKGFARLGVTTPCTVPSGDVVYTIPRGFCIVEMGGLTNQSLGFSLSQLPEATGVIDSVTGANVLNVAASFAGGDLGSLITPIDTEAVGTNSSKYYVEIVSGAMEGLRMDIASLGSDSITLDATSMYNTSTTAAGTAGSHFVIRRHSTLIDVADYTVLNALGAGGNSAASADIVNFLEGGSYITYFSNAGISGAWQCGAQCDIGKVVPAGTCLSYLFKQEVSAVRKFVQVGEVRYNDFQKNLPAGTSFLSPVYGLDASPEQMAMTVANGFLVGASEASADVIYLLSGNETPGTSGYISRYLWGNNIWLNPQAFTIVTSDPIFETSRGNLMYIWSAGGVSWTIPVQWDLSDYSYLP